MQETINAGIKTGADYSSGHAIHAIGALVGPEDGTEAHKGLANTICLVNAMTWKPFPQALIISDGKIIFDRLEGKLTDEKEVLDFLVK